MSEKTTYQTIEELYNSPKSKKFIIHLIRSFFPLTKSSFMMFADDKKELKCCVTGQGLISKDVVLTNMLSDSDNHFRLFIGSISESLSENNTGEKNKQYQESIKKITNNKVLAIQSTESDKLLCQDALDQLYNFYCTKILSGDKEMNWVGKSMQLKSFKEKVPLTQPENKVITKAVNKPASLNLNDNLALQQLKAKLDNKS